MSKTYVLVVPELGFIEYRPEIAFLAAGALTPIAVLLLSGNGEYFERSGSIAVFCAAVAEFVALNRLTKKHFLNACRAKEGEIPWGISSAFSLVGKAAFSIGLMGTVVWGFGSKWV